VRARLRRERKTPPVRAALKGKTKAKSAEKSEFIAINGEAHNARGAALLVNTTAQTYVKRQNAHYRREVEAAIALSRRQIRRIEAGQLQSTSTSKDKAAAKGSASTRPRSSPRRSAPRSTSWKPIWRCRRLRRSTRPSQSKSKLLSPHPRSNALFGFAIGLVLAAFAAYALSRLDRRLRSLAAIEEIFQTQVLTALRSVRRPLLHRDGHPVPAYVLREALWRLQTTLQVGSSAVDNGHASVPGVENGRASSPA